MTEDNLLQSALAAEAVAPGEWRYRPLEFDGWGIVRGPPLAGRDDGVGYIFARAYSGNHNTTEDEKNEHRRNGTDPYEACARFIATASPSRIRQELAEKAALAAENERLRKALEEADRFVGDLIAWGEPRSRDAFEARSDYSDGYDTATHDAVEGAETLHATIRAALAQTGGEG